MKVAPIIHSRTYSCDFNSEFKVRPAEFMNDDIKWARKVILDGTSSIDSLKGERWIVADNGKYRIAGIIGFLKNICSQCNLTEEQKKTSEELFCDDKGRSIYAFIGIVMNTSERDNIKITYDYLWNTFVEFIQPIWKRNFQEAIAVEFKEYYLETVEAQKPDVQSQCVNSKKLYETNPSTDYLLFNYYLQKRSASKFSFCSNITDINVVKQCGFSILTTSRNVITRLSKLNTVSSDSEAQTLLSGDEFKVSEENNTQLIKKKLLIPLTICLVTFAIIILILLLGNLGLDTR